MGKRQSLFDMRFTWATGRGAKFFAGLAKVKCLSRESIHYFCASSSSDLRKSFLWLSARESDTIYKNPGVPAMPALMPSRRSFSISSLYFSSVRQVSNCLSSSFKVRA